MIQRKASSMFRVQSLVWFSTLRARSMTHLLATRSIALAILVLSVQLARADDDCDVPSEAWQPRSAVRALAERNGWRVERLKIDDGCYEIKARDTDDRRFSAKLNPMTLEVVRMKRERRDRERRHDILPEPLPAGSPRGGVSTSDAEMG